MDIWNTLDGYSVPMKVIFNTKEKHNNNGVFVLLTFEKII